MKTDPQTFYRQRTTYSPHLKNEFKKNFIANNKTTWLVTIYSMTVVNMTRNHTYLTCGTSASPIDSSLF